MVPAARRSAIVLVLAAAVLLLATPAASAAGSIVCEQYPDLPQCTVTAGVGDADAGAPAAGGTAQGGAPVSGTAAIPGAGSATAEPGKAGELPFTGYPLSPLAAAVLVLLAAGIAIRASLAMRRRLSVAGREGVL